LESSREVIFLLEKRIPLKVGKAVENVMAHASGGETEVIRIDHCNQRFLGEDILATNDVPLFTRSGYDGYAIRSRDTEYASSVQAAELKVLEVLGAGMVPSKDISTFQATRIMTGAMIPPGADAVIMLEAVKEVEKEGERYIQVKRKVQKGENISYQGEEVEQGELILKKGTYINPGITAVLATFGYASVKVTRRMKVGIFATGSELLEVDEPLQSGKIRNSNSYMIVSQIKRAGAAPVYLGKLPDELDTCTEAISQALEEVDILITTGGVSVGDFDFMPMVYSQIGANLLFNKIKMRPGSVTTVAEYRGKLLFGLSGNPSACFVGFELLVRPVIRKWNYSPNPHLKKIKAILDTEIAKTNPLTRFVRSKLIYRDNGLFVAPTGLDKSNVVMTLVDADSFILLQGKEQGFKKGETVDVLLLEDQEGSQWPWD
jgi:molybdopterin molybdotransferase